MRNTYADIEIPLEQVLHGAARLHVELARNSGASLTTRGWTYNELVSCVVVLATGDDEALMQRRCLETLWDTLDGACDIGAAAVGLFGCAASGWGGG